MTPALDRLLRRLGRRRVRTREKPLRDELLSIERLEERAKALAARLTVDPTPRRNARERVPALRRQRARPARGVPQHGRGRAPGRVRDGGGGVAARQLPPGGFRDPRRPPEPAARLLPRAAQARHAGARRRRARLRPGRGADPPQRQPPRPAAARALPEQLPDGGAPHDRRAVGLAEHAQARSHREPAPPGGRGDRRARGAPGGRRLRGPDRRGRPRATAAAPAGDPPGVRRAAAAARARVRPATLGRARGGRRPPPRAAHGLGGGDPQRAPAPGGGAGLGRERDHEPPPLLDPRLEPVLRVGEPRRAGAAARPGRRLRPHGLPEPRPLPPGGRGAGRPHRRGPAPGGPADGRERSPGRRGRNRRARGPRRPPPHRQGPRRPRGRRGLPAPARCVARGGSCSPTPPRPTSARSRS